MDQVPRPRDEGRLRNSAIAAPVSTGMTFQTYSAVIAASLLLTACGMDVDRDADGRQAKVDIRTPFGNVNVRTAVDASATGLPIYPGSRPAETRRNEPESANVTVGNSYFGVNVVAAKFEHDDAPGSIVDYYKQAMRKYGDVLECHGNIDFKGRNSHPVCRERRGSQEIQLASGTEDRHRIVVVKPRGQGSEFSTVYIETRGTT
jgi:hypothetical protein